MEEICHSVSKMIHKIPKPTKKTGKIPNSKTKPGKVFSSPNLLQLPSGQHHSVAVTQTRSKSTSYIADKDHPPLEKVSPSDYMGSFETRMQNSGVTNKTVDLKDNSIYQNEVFANDLFPKTTTEKRKKSPPKRPPPPKVLPKRYQNNVYANIQRSKSDPQINKPMPVYANFHDGILDTIEHEKRKDLSIYINQVTKTKEPKEILVYDEYEEVITEPLGETYFSMTEKNDDDDDVDDYGYVMMSRDRSMTS